MRKKKKNIFEMQSESIVCAEMITDEKTRNKKKLTFAPNRVRTWTLRIQSPTP